MTEHHLRPSTQVLRRAVPRQPADWFGFYRFDDAQDERWRSCRVIDVSPAGAGLELFELAPEEMMDGLITVSMELHGETRNVVMDKDIRAARVGVQFPTLTDAAREYIKTLGGTRTRW